MLIVIPAFAGMTALFWSAQQKFTHFGGAGNSHLEQRQH
jgi:glycerol kinase